MGNSVGDIFLNLILNSKGFNAQLKGLKGIAMKSAAAIGAAFSVKALANFSKQCIDLGSDLQEVQNVVDVTFGNMSDKVNKFAQQATTTAGLSETMAKKYAGTFGAMAKSFKFDPKEVYDMSTALTTLTGDVASFYNLSQDEAYTKLKSVFTGETESLKDLGVVMTQTALDQFALEQGLGKTTAAMSEQEKVALRYKFVTEQLDAASGDFIRTQNSWANQTRILSLQIESFKAAIGQGLINILTPVIKWINLLMQKLVAAANAFKTFTETLFGKPDSGSTKANTTTDDLDNVAASADGATAATNKTTEAAKKLKRELAGFDQITKLGSEDESSGADASTPSASTGGTTTTAPASPIPEDDNVSAFAEKYGKLAKSVENFQLKFKLLTDLLSGAGKWVMDNILKPLGNWTMNELAPAAIDALASAFGFLTTALEFLKPVWDWIWKNLFKPIANFVGDAIVISLEKISGVFDVLTAALTVLKPIWDWIWKNLFEPVGKFIGDAFTKTLETWAAKLAIVPAGLTLLKEAIESLPGKIEEIKEKVKEKWDALLANVKGKLVDFGAKIATKWEDLKAEWEALKGNIRNKVADFKAKIATKWADLKEAWTKLKANATGKTANIKAKVASKWNDLKGKWNNLLGNFKDKAVSVTLSIKGKVADIKKWFNESVIDKVNAKIHKVPFLENVSIPHLAQGGFVKKNTPQLAMIGDNRHYGEIVAPENKLEEMARIAAAGAGGTSPEVIALLREIVVLLKTLDLDVTVDGKSLMGIIVKLINQQTKSTGVCPITV